MKMIVFSFLFLLNLINKIYLVFMCLSESEIESLLIDTFLNKMSIRKKKYIYISLGVGLLFFSFSSIIIVVLFVVGKKF